MRALIRLLDRLATGKWVAALGVLAVGSVAALNTLDFPVSVVHMQRLTGFSILDTQGFIGPARVWQLLDGYGEAGRQLQLRIMLSVDILLPALMAAFLWAAIALGYRSAFGAGHWTAKLRYLGLAAFGLDYLENAFILVLLARYPARSELVATLFGLASGTKSLAYAAAVLVALAGLLAMGLGRLRQGRRPAAPTARPHWR